jgi:dihydrofolate reductase
MGTLTVTSFITLDGVMQSPGGRDEDRTGEFEHGGWFVPFVADEEFGRFIDAIFARADAFLLGRGTYQVFASHWPRVTDPADLVASRLNGLPKHVASRTLRRLDWRGASLLGADVPGAVRALKARYARELQVHGSPGLLQTLLADDLVDVLHLLVAPVVLGTGKRLFGPGIAPAAFALDACRATPSGLALQTYRRTGRPAYGNIGLETQGG